MRRAETSGAPGGVFGADPADAVPTRAMRAATEATSAGRADAVPAGTAAIDAVDAALIDALQDGVALVERPFDAIAATLGLSAEAVVERLAALLRDGILSRFGPMFDADRFGGALTLAAIAVPPERFDEVCGQVNAFAEVAHNYAREHRFNMWFVVAAETPALRDAAIAAIERRTGLPVLDLPKEVEYFVGLRFDVGSGRAGRIARRAGAQAAARIELDRTDRAIVLASQAGLPLTVRPFAALAERVDLSEPALIERLARMLQAGAVRRIAAVPNHYRLGFTANGMTVWDIDDADIEAAGSEVGALPFVTHCYRRPRRLPHWRFNLFAMVHGRDRDEVEHNRGAIAALLGERARAGDVLYSTRVLKKTGLRLGAARPD